MVCWSKLRNTLHVHTKYLGFQIKVHHLVENYGRSIRLFKVLPVKHKTLFLDQTLFIFQDNDTVKQSINSLQE